MSDYLYTKLIFFPRFGSEENEKKKIKLNKKYKCVWLLWSRFFCGYFFLFLATNRRFIQFKWNSHMSVTPPIFLPSANITITSMRPGRPESSKPNKHTLFSTTHFSLFFLSTTNSLLKLNKYKIKVIAKKIML